MDLDDESVDGVTSYQNQRIQYGDDILYFV